mmetsp:Transcript_17725/g.30126  ORF Transcript_17725/g.30126 Transcript_17725/m.30126 type:complete len:428 (-) Transcript_17725:855-2138(-)
MLEKEGWIEETGGTLRSDLVGLHDFDDGTGRGMIALQDIKKGTVLVEAPHSALVSSANVLKLGSKKFQQAMKLIKQRVSETDLMAIFLMWARCDENKKHLSSKFQKYMEMLPAVQEGPSALEQSMFWDEDQLDLLKGTDSYMIAIQLKAQVREDFGVLLKDVFLKFPKIFPLDTLKYTYKEYKWALGIIWSRGMDFGSNKDTSFRAIVPYADMFNTDFEGPVTHYYVTNKKVAHVVAKQDFSKGEQVFINYTPTTNTRLLQVYGFARRPPCNAKNEHIQLWATMDEKAPIFEDASKVIASLLGINPNKEPFLLKESDPLPNSLLIALHAQRAKPLPIGTQKPDLEILNQLQTALEERKAKFVNDRMTDLQLLIKPDSLTPRETIALYIRVTESRILDKTTRLLESMIDSLQVNSKVETKVSQLDLMD